MLKQRVISAIVLLAFVLLALLYFSPYAFALTIGVIAILGVWEWCQFAKHKRDIWRYIVTGLSACLLYLTLYAYQDKISAGIVLTNNNSWLLYGAMLWWLTALLMVLSYPTSAKFWDKPALWQLLFGFFTLAPFVLSLLSLRLYNYNLNPYSGLILLLYVLVLVWVADSGAYFCGRALGKHKLASLVSPKKTWEGLIGGVICALIAGVIYVKLTPDDFILRQLPIATLLLVSLGTILISILGDLTESMFKRDAGIKDSSQLIPGHGGVLDRIDSLTAALPFFCLMFYLLT
ncbi:phosphatidate cytidylyltransferase [Spirabiliibacterium falconis]|uniref:phosphatidate cytidylyltransferase n=1 Tax=Spirabiliibacterium falconis TaxID=572023 RepID=UPI001AAC92D6|nr:phosphatidate cytidylyltransferase [Spirabiliibacterium falconis]MBE2895023.1 phosphatidate cytidylyltransferase [Spirabiliibacterium falconis]